MDPSVRVVLNGCGPKTDSHGSKDLNLSPSKKNYFVFSDGSSFIKSWRIKKIFVKSHDSVILKIVFWTTSPPSDDYLVTSLQDETTIKIYQDIVSMFEDLRRVEKEFKYLLFLSPFFAIDGERLQVISALKRKNHVLVYFSDSKEEKVYIKHYTCLKENSGYECFYKPTIDELIEHINKKIEKIPQITNN